MNTGFTVPSLGTPVPKKTIDQWIDIGLQAQQAERLEEAERWYRAAYNLQPDHFDALQLLGLVCIRRGDTSQGISLLRQALTIRPEESMVLHNLGQALRRSGAASEGLALLRQAHQSDPKDLQILLNLGLAEFEHGAFSEAILVFERGRQIAPNHSNVHLYAGLAHQQLNQPHHAILSFARAIEADSHNGDARLALGIAFSNVKEYAGAAECFAAAMPLVKPSQRFQLMIHWGYVGLELGDWSIWAQVLATLNEQDTTPESHADPFKTMHFPVSADLLQQSAELYAREQRPYELTTPFTPNSTKVKRTRIAYLSPDFSEHPVGRLVAPVVSHHDRERFEIYCYGWNGDNSHIHQAIVASAEHFTDVSTLTDAQVVSQLHADGIDIAIDLAGYTLNSRPRIFASRAAPVQINWLGYPGTLGAQAMDYLLTDVVAVHSREQQAISEAVIRLPAGFMAYDSTTVIAPSRGRTAYSLPENAIVLACFAQIRKINPIVFDLWMSILRDVPHAVLWLPDFPEEVRARLRMEATRRSVNAGRLIFATTAPDHSEYLGRYAAADIALDTFPYGSHSTALDALWTGTPLIALCGETVASRISASVLAACDLSNLIANDPQHYQTLAIHLAKHPAALADVRQQIARAIKTATIFDPAKLVRHLEDAYTFIHARAASGKAPESFDLT